jgi:CheY-like chemotaxis protein
MGQARILVVDDEPFNLEIIAEYLADCDYSLVFAKSGEEALAQLEAGSFDLVVLDRMMPGADGIEVLRAMKASAPLRDIPVVMQTAAATPGQVREGLVAGALYYLTKPFEPESLLAIVRAALCDRSRRLELAGRIADHGAAMRLVERAEFSVQTLDEAGALALTAALVCDNPEPVAIGLAELLVNGIEHGNLGIDFVEKGRLKEQGAWKREVARRLALVENREKRVWLALWRQGTCRHFRVRDEGAGFDWRRFLELDPERAFAPNGRGIVLARSLAFTGLEYSGSGNEVHAWVDQAVDYIL